MGGGNTIVALILYLFPSSDFFISKSLSTLPDESHLKKNDYLREKEKGKSTRCFYQINEREMFSVIHWRGTKRPGTRALDPPTAATGNITTDAVVI